jgi:hypothetical protein
MSLIKLKNNALDNLTSFEGSASLGDMVLISSAVASASSSIEFTLGDYKEYKFFFVNIHPQTDAVLFEFNGSTDSGSNYNVTKTTTFIDSAHREDNTDTAFGYATGRDLAQSTSFQQISGWQLGNDTDHNASGYLQLFNPSSSVFVKHFISNMNMTNYNTWSASWQSLMAGYFNTTSPITNLKFQMSSGNIDDGKILMFGLN